MLLSSCSSSCSNCVILEVLEQGNSHKIIISINIKLVGMEGKGKHKMAYGLSSQRKTMAECFFFPLRGLDHSS